MGDDVSVAEVLRLRNCQGLTEIEIWSILCQSAQSLQDLFLSYDESKKCDPIITLNSLLLTSQGRAIIKPFLQGCIQTKDMLYLAPEFDPTLPHPYAEIQLEKMWLYSLGVCVKHMFTLTLTVSRDLSDVVLQLTRKDPSLRCNLLFLLNVISDYCKRKDQSQPFCSIIMELHAFVKSSKNTFSKIKRKRPSSCAEIDTKDYMSYDDILLRSESDDVQKRPIQRAPSRLYKFDADIKTHQTENTPINKCIGPEFVIRAIRQPAIIHIGDIKPVHQRKVMIILLNGHKLEVTCDAAITAGQLFEVVVQNEYITENFTLGLAALVSGDFIFLPPDSRLNRVIPNPASSKLPYTPAFTLYLRVKFYLPSLRGIRCLGWKHQLYLQLRRNVLTRQLRCDSIQLFTLAGLALQAEFGDYVEEQHGCGDYFLAEHYLPESSISNSCEKSIIAELQIRHKERIGVPPDRAEELFIIFCQQMSEYGTHFYSAHLVCKDLRNFKGDVWLGVNLHGVFYCNKKSSSRSPVQLFMWSNIKKLEYQKYSFCLVTQIKNVKFKFKMDSNKSFYAFHLASLHHKFFLKLRLEMSLKSLSEEFGVPVISKHKSESKKIYIMKEEKKMKQGIGLQSNNNRANIMRPSCNNTTESRTLPRTLQKCKRNRASTLDKENLVPDDTKCNTLTSQGKILKSEVTPKLPRRFTQKPSKLFASQQSLHTLSYGSLSSLYTLTRPESPGPEVYILSTSINSLENGQHLEPLPDESISESLITKFENLSWTEDDRLLTTVRLKRSPSGCLGIEVTEGLNGGVYIQSVLTGGPADKLRKIQRGDRIVTVNGKDLLSYKYKKAIQIIQKSGTTLDLVLSQLPFGVESPSLPQKPQTICTDFSQKPIEESYFRSIRYQTGPDEEDHMESGELPSLTSLSSSLKRSLPSLTISNMEMFHASQSFII